jgi:hypothetical protein
MATTIAIGTRKDAMLSTVLCVGCPEASAEFAAAPVV